MPLAKNLSCRQLLKRAPKERSKKSLRSNSMPSSGRSCPPLGVGWRKFGSLAEVLPVNWLRPRDASATPIRPRKPGNKPVDGFWNGAEGDGSDRRDGG